MKLLLLLLTVRHPAVFARLALTQLARFARQETLAWTRRHRAPDRLLNKHKEREKKCIKINSNSQKWNDIKKRN